MSSEVDISNRSVARPDEPGGSSNGTAPRPEEGKLPEPTTMAPPSTGSTDDLTTLLAQAKPDPFLDPAPAAAEGPPRSERDGDDPQAVDASQLTVQRVAPGNSAAPPEPAAAAPPPGVGATPDPADVVVGGPVAPIADLMSSSEDEPRYPSGSHDERQASANAGAEVLAWLAASVVTPRPEDPAERLPLQSDDTIAPIDVGPTPSPKASDVRVTSDDAEDDEDEFDDEPARGPSWLVVLLASYASAVTLGLIWVLMGHRSMREAPEPEFDDTPAVQKLDPGRRAENSRKVTPPAPLAADRITSIGKSLTIGEVEVTPVAVTAGPVVLHRTISGPQSQEGGANALKLRLRLRNISKDSIFAPLDEAFLRERDAGVFDSFIELGNGQVIDMFPLSVFSEWEIIGQTFKELKPGETLDSQVVSVADAVARKTAEMTWRVRIRTGIEQSEVFGVTFRDDQIRSEP